MAVFKVCIPLSTVIIIYQCMFTKIIYTNNVVNSLTGFAKLVSESRSDTQKVHWVLPPTISASQLGSVFKLDWIHRFVTCNNAKKEMI